VRGEDRTYKSLGAAPEEIITQRGRGLPEFLEKNYEKKTLVKKEFAQVKRW